MTLYQSDNSASPFGYQTQIISQPAPYQIRLFGAGQIFDPEDRPIRLRSRKTLALLAFLTVENAIAHRRDYLAGLFWPEMPEAAARNNLRVTLNRVRKLFPLIERPFLRADRHTVRLDLNDELWLDGSEFLDRIDFVETHVHTALSKCSQCVSALDAATQLYTGDFLQGFHLENCEAFEEWVLTARQHFYLQAVELQAQLTRIRVAQGDIGAAENAAQRWLALDPLQEEAHRQLMFVLASQGKRKAALSQFERCCSLLEEELGVPPATETTALYEKIRSGKAGPAHLHRTKATGSAAAKAIDSLTEPIKEPRGSAHNLPQQLTPFFGREAELDQLHSRLSHPTYRLITIVGHGGVGKSRIAQQAAVGQLTNYTEGVYFVPLSGVQSVKSIPTAILEALGTGPLTDERSIRQQLFDIIGERRILLVLDNFEHLMGGIYLVTDLLRKTPNLVVLVTSRECFDIDIEDLFELSGLPVPSSADDPEATAYDSIRLFVDRAHRLDKSFKLKGDSSCDELEHIVRICRFLEGSPLAIELASTWIRDLTCAEIVKELDGGLNRLESYQRHTDPQHRSLQAVFDSSWRLLTAEEQDALAKLSLFRDGFSAHAAREVAGIPIQILGALRNKSLLHGAGSRRYDMLALVQQFSSDALAEIGDRAVAELRQAHSRYYLDAVAQEGPRLLTSEAKNALARLRSERANIERAWRWAVDAGEYELLDRSLWSLGRFYRMAGHFEEGERLLSAPIDRLRASDRPALRRLAGHLLIQTGTLQARQWRNETCVASYREGLELTDDHGFQVLGYVKLARHLTYYPGDFNDARATVLKGLRIAQESRNPEFEAAALTLLGFIDFHRGDHKQARKSLDRAYSLAESIDDLNCLHDVLAYIYSLSIAENEMADALDYLKRLDQIVQLVGNRRSETRVAHYRSNLCNMLGRYEEGISAALSGQAIAAEVGDREYESLILHMLCDSYRSIGQMDRAEAAGQRALTLAQSLSFSLGIAYAQTYLAQVHFDRGKLEEARDAFREAVDHYSAIGKAQGALEPLAGLALVMLESEGPEAALQIVEEILKIMDGGPVSGVDHPLRVYWSCYHVLDSAGDDRAAPILREGNELLIQIAKRLESRELRETFLSADVATRKLQEAYSQ